MEWRRIFFRYLELACVSDILMGFSNGTLMEVSKNFKISNYVIITISDTSGNIKSK